MSQQTKKIFISGMHCRSCELLIEDQLKKIPGIASVKANQKTGQVELFYQGQEPNSETIAKEIISAGYQMGKQSSLPWLSNDYRDYRDLLLAVGILAVIVFLISQTGVFNFFNISVNETGLFTALIVGLVAGVSTWL